MSFPDRLVTDRLVLRAPQDRDRAAYVGFYRSDRRRATRPAHVSDEPVAELNQRFDLVLAHWHEHGFGRFIVTADDDTARGLIGPIAADDSWPEDQLAWHLFTDDAEGRGIAREAACASRAAAEAHLGWTTMVSYIRPENTRSIRLAERLGARPDPDSPRSARYPRHDIYRHPAPETQP